MPRRIAPEVIEKLAELWQAGETLPEIGAQIGKLPATVAQLRRRAFLAGDTRFAPRITWRKELRQERKPQSNLNVEEARRELERLYGPPLTAASVLRLIEELVNADRPLLNVYELVETRLKPYKPTVNIVTSIVSLVNYLRRYRQRVDSFEERIQLVDAAAAIIRRQIGRDPTNAELAAVLGRSRGWVQMVRPIWAKLVEGLDEAEPVEAAE